MVANDRGQAEEQRDAGGDHGAEGEQQDEQRAAEGELHGLGLVGRLGGGRGHGARRRRRTPRRAARDEPSGPRRRRRAGASADSISLASSSSTSGRLKLTTTERPSSETVSARSALFSGLWMSVTPSIALEALHGVLDGGGDLRSVGLDRALALDQDLLADGLGEVGGLHDLHGALGLAVAHLSRRQVLHGEALAGEGGDDDEEDPADDGGLSMLRAPTSGASSQVAWGVHARQCPSGAPALPTGHPASVGAAWGRARVRRSTRPRCGLRRPPVRVAPGYCAGGPR